MSHVTTLAALLVVLALGAGCSAGAGGTELVDDPAAITAPTSDPAPGNDPAPAPGGDVVEVVLEDYRFRDLPDRVPAGTRLTVRNESAHELHELVAFRIPDDEPRGVALLAGLPPDELLEALGPPVAVLLSPPGSDEVVPAVGDGTLAEPGRYGIFCFIPTGADPDEYLAAPTEDGPPQVDGGPPHALRGMVAELVVE